MKRKSTLVELPEQESPAKRRKITSEEEGGKVCLSNVFGIDELGMAITDHIGDTDNSVGKPFMLRMLSLVSKDFNKMSRRAAQLLNLRIKYIDDQRYATHAALMGYVKCLKYLVSTSNFTFRSLMYHAASAGQLDVMKYVATLDVIEADSVARGAAAGGHLNCLKYAHEIGSKIDVRTCIGAITEMKHDCLVFCLEKCKIRDERCNRDGTHKSSTHSECALFDEGSGCQMDRIMARTAASKGDLKSLEILKKHGGRIDVDEITEAAARKGSLEVLKYVHESGAPFSSAVCSQAALGGYLDCLIYAHENGSPWDNLTTERAAAARSLECVKYAVENGCPVGTACDEAAVKGHLECIQYLHSKGVRLEKSAKLQAAHNEHFECFKYLVENGDREWCGDTALSIVWRSDNLELLVYAVKNGCPVSSETLLGAYNHKREACFEFLFEREGLFSDKLIESAIEQRDLDLILKIEARGKKLKTRRALVKAHENCSKSLLPTGLQPVHKDDYTRYDQALKVLQHYSQRREQEV